MELSRTEQILKYGLGEVSTLPPNLSRIEELLVLLIESGGTGGGGGGTTNYNTLNNKPSIEGNTLQGNKTLSQLGIQSALVFDSTPTTGSNNPVTSSGIATALSGKVASETGKGLSTNDYTDAEKAKLAGIESGAEVNTILKIYVNGTEVSANTNREVYLTVLTNTVSNLMYYYTKSETYTKEEIENLVGSVAHLSMEIVSDLPETGESNVIYLIPSGANNVYSQYIYTNSTWSLIGSTEIDLSNYYTKSQVDDMLGNKQDELTFDNAPTQSSANPVTSDGIYTALERKVDAETGKGLSTNDFSDEYKQKVDDFKDTGVGENVEGTTFTVDGYDRTAEAGAERFNDYTNNIAIGGSSHSEGSYTKAVGSSSHAEGNWTYAVGRASHAEGSTTRAEGADAHAEGTSTTANGFSSHSEGYFTVADSQYQHVEGKYNAIDSAEKFAFIIGNGTGDNARSNALAVDWDGRIYVGNSSNGIDIRDISGSVEYGASTERTGKVTVTGPSDGTSTLTFDVTFDKPMPDADYEITLSSGGGFWNRSIDKVVETTKTKNGFRIAVTIVNNFAGYTYDIYYRAFKLFTVEGLEELENDVADLQTVNKRTQAACTSVAITGTTVYARKRNGIVTVNGATQLSANLTRNSWVSLLTIPTGYRPANYEYGTAVIDTGQGGVTCPVDISSAGILRVFTYGLSIPEDVDLTNKYIFISATFTTTN